LRSGGHALVIGGPYEFISDDGEDQAVESSYAPLAKAYDALRYDAGALSQAEAAKFQSLSVTPPAGWVTLDAKEPKTVILTVNGHKIGVVYFPEAKHPGDLPSQDVLDRVSHAVKELRPQVELVAGVSPWGVTAENDYLDKTHPDLDILFGAGLGVGFMARPTASGKTLWTHAFYKGKALYTIDLLALPGAKDFKWEAGKNFAAKAVSLDDSVAADPAMRQMLENVRDPGEARD